MNQDNSQKSVAGNPTQRLQQLMRSGWDRRIAADYLGWMNDRVVSDKEMWATGQRDFDALMEGVDLKSLSELTALELGCGVGRIIRPSSFVFKHVIATDISKAAIEKAKTLLRKRTNIEYLVGNGMNLQPVKSGSVDYVLSFGVLSNMPVIACANYLLEITRVLKSNGQARIQVFLGKCQPTVREDTVAFRSFNRDAYLTVLESLGLSILWIKELDVGAELPDDGWLKPQICALQKTGKATLTAQEIESLLAPAGEPSAAKDWPGSETEYLLCVTRAKELIEAGDREAGKAALKFAIDNYGNPDPRLISLYQTL